MAKNNKRNDLLESPENFISAVFDAAEKKPESWGNFLDKALALSEKTLKSIEEREKGETK